MTNDLRPYLEYKDSGVPWLGRVPAHWAVIRCKYLFREVDERSKTGEETHLSMSQQHGLIPSRELDGRRLHSESYAGGKLCQTNDLVLNRLKAHLGVFAHARQPGLVSPDYTVLRPVHGGDVVYFELVFKTPPCVAELRCSTKGIVEGFWRLYTDDFYNIRVPLPPESERISILRYVKALDAKVRRFISNRRRLIGVLSEQKQAIINRAVTRGLDPQAPLKPSGIDWLGYIPSHWGLQRLRRLAHIKTGGRDTIHRRDDGQYPFFVRSQTVERIDSYSFDGEAVLTAGDGAGVAKVFHYVNGKFDYHQRVYKLSHFREVSGKYFFHYFRATLRFEAFRETAKSTVDSLRLPMLKDFPVPVPPMPEQAEIVSFIESELSMRDRMIEVALCEIGLIREYRTRLIADVVTGKVDVRQESVATMPAAKKPANIHFRRSVFAAEIVHRLHAEPTFGHVKFEKLIFLCEKHCGVDTGSTYHRQAAGPYDNRALRSIDTQIKKQKWYEAKKRDKGYRYVSLEKAGGHKGYFDRYFGDVTDRFDEIINTFRRARSDQCEIAATLYAAWEDLLAQGDATDDQIIEQVLNHWHPAKQRIAEARWRRAIDWMKKKGLTPLGVGNGPEPLEEVKQ